MINFKRPKSDSVVSVTFLIVFIKEVKINMYNTGVIKMTYTLIIGKYYRYIN